MLPADADSQRPAGAGGAAGGRRHAQRARRAGGRRARRRRVRLWHRRHDRHRSVFKQHALFIIKACVCVCCSAASVDIGSIHFSNATQSYSPLFHSECSTQCNIAVCTGCIMARVCHTNNCPVGVASQREELRARFPGCPADLVNYFHFVAEEVPRSAALLHSCIPTAVALIAASTSRTLRFTACNLIMDKHVHMHPGPMCLCCCAVPDRCFMYSGAGGACGHGAAVAA